MPTFYFPLGLQDNLGWRARALPLQILILIPFLSVPTSLVRADEVDFDRDIRPILSENCSFCHGPDEATREADLRLDTPEGAWSTVEKNHAAESQLFQRITSDDPDELMPPADSNRSLTAEQIERVRRWIDQGAPWEQHWSFQPIESQEVPGSIHPIDAIVQQQLESRGMQLSPEAAKAVLIRRLTLDLNGLPPTPDDVARFLADDKPGAYQRLVDRLLDSKAYGQRIAWGWLDAARYADTNGYQGDNERTMWPWRDWVVRAFNDNMPYDQFTIWQLAGDLLPNSTSEQTLATAFLRNQMINGEGGRIAEENRVEYVMEMLETMGTVWLGLTLNCWRCHDHKYDPITNEEYYKMFAIFNQTPIDGSGGNARTKPIIAVPNADQAMRIDQLGKQIADADVKLAELAESLVAKQADWEKEEAKLVDSNEELQTALAIEPEQRSDQQRNRIVDAYHDSVHEYVDLREPRERQAKQLSDIENRIPKVMVMGTRKEPRKSFMLTRGLYNQPTSEVTAGLPASFLSESTTDKPMNRLTLAQWLVDPENPLTARVTVNRFWQQFFGIGLVKTTEDFGAQGEIPEYRALLDYLADDFRSNGWDLKRLVRLIVTSETYRQSSKIGTHELYENDPGNRLLARGSRYRMPAWMLRDQALASSGLLSDRSGGASVNTYQPPDVWEDASFGKKKYSRDRGEKLYRRSLYVYWRRIIAPPIFFDNAKRQVCEVKPNRTNTPLHALQLLNDVTYVESARALAQSVLQSKAVSDKDRVDVVMRRLLARDASEDEMGVLIKGLQRTRRQYTEVREDATKLLSLGESTRDLSLDPVEHAAWTCLCLAVLNLDETLTRE